jgi:serine/threonine protein kinase
MGNCWSKKKTNEDEEEEDDGTQIASKSMFAFKMAVGKSAYGIVWKALKKSNNAEYAIKVMDKATIFNMRSIDCIMNEHHLLASLRYPFIVNMHYAFHEKKTVYLVQRFMSGGNLRYHMEQRLKRKQEISEDEARYIIGCVVLGLEYLHNNGVIHRDIRPENILLNSRGLCKLTDFQLSRIWREENSSDISGSPGYCAPEVLNRKKHGPCVDWFAVGVVTYELMLGKKPWTGDDRKTYKESLMEHDAVLKKADTPESWNHEASDFINKCLVRNPLYRLGVNGTNEIKAHVWFKEFDWVGL